MNTTANKTPYGEACIIPEEGLAALIRAQARGCYQEKVADNLCTQGYVIRRLADGGPLAGKAAQYQSHYMRSVENLMDRIIEVLPDGYYLLTGAVGPRGGAGYYLSL
jgi:hypothetical protein